MTDVLKDVSRSLSMWRIWARLGVQDVRLRFRRSSLGVAWIFVTLTINIMAIGLIYGALFKQDVRHFIPMLTIGLVIWGYLTSSVVDGGNAFVASEGYITQIPLPIYVYIFRWFVSISLTVLISLTAYFVVAILFQVPMGLGLLWAVPGMVLLAIISLLVIAIFAHLNAHFRDTSHLASSIMMVFFYVTPIIWPAELLRERGLDQVVDYNPFYHILEVVKQPLLYSRPADSTNYLVVVGIILITSCVVAFLLRYYYRRIVFFL